MVRLPRESSSPSQPAATPAGGPGTLPSHAGLPSNERFAELFGEFLEITSVEVADDESAHIVLRASDGEVYDRAQRLAPHLVRPRVAYTPDNALWNWVCFDVTAPGTVTFVGGQELVIADESESITVSSQLSVIVRTVGAFRVGDLALLPRHWVAPDPHADDPLGSLNAL